jgi:hypothetical protein
MNRHIKSARELIGKQFNRLTIQKILTSRTNDGHVLSECVCDCGTVLNIRLSYVKTGKTKSCGCLNVESVKINLKKAQRARPGLQPRLGSAKKIFTDRYSDGNLSFEEFVVLSQEKCFYCGDEPKNTYNAYKYANSRFSKQRIQDGDFIYNGLDRINSLLNHDRDNVVPSCEDCNKAKLTRSVHDFLVWVEKIHAFQMEKSCRDPDRKQSFEVSGTISSSS